MRQIEELFRSLNITGRSFFPSLTFCITDPNLVEQSTWFDFAPDSVLALFRADPDKNGLGLSAGEVVVKQSAHGVWEGHSYLGFIGSCDERLPRNNIEQK